MGLGTLAFSFVHVRWVILLFLFLFSPGFGRGSILRGAILREYFGRDSFGKMLGIVMGSAAVGGIIGPTVAGWVFDTLGSYHVIWLVFGGVIGLAIGLTLRIR
jgi:MFS family permease